MRVLTVPCRSDNFTYLVGDSGRSDVAVVDPCDAEPTLAAARGAGLRISAILNTHHHGDHVGGNLGVLAAFPGIPVYAHPSDQPRIPGFTHGVDEGDEVVAAGLRFRVSFVPGHTRGHIAYVTEEAAFVGDTLFGAGCGRLFEGTAEQLHDSIAHKLAQLPPTTRLYFAHEYTESNLRFALAVEPNNAEIQARINDVRAARARGEWTTPSVLELEKRTNPFLRVTEPAPVAYARASQPEATTPAQVFAALRKAKDTFR